MSRYIVLIMTIILMVTAWPTQPSVAVIIDTDKPYYELTIDISEVQILTKPQGNVQIAGSFQSGSYTMVIDPANEPVWLVIAKYDYMTDTPNFPTDPSLWFNTPGMNIIYPKDPGIMPLTGFEDKEMGWCISDTEQYRTGIEECNILGSQNSLAYFFNLVDESTEVAKADLSNVLIGLKIGNSKGAVSVDLAREKNELLWLGPVDDGPPTIPPDWSNLQPREIVLSLADEVDLLAENDELNDGQHNALSVELDGAIANIMQAEPVDMLRDLKQFENKVCGFVNGQILEVSQGTHLIEGANVAAEKVRDDVFKREVFTHPVFPCIPDLTEDDPIYVAPSAGPKSLSSIGNGKDKGGIFEPAPDGSITRPYHTINDAVDNADPEFDEAVVIIVRRGVYVEDVEITHHTHIYGGPGVILLGSVINNGPYELRIENLTIMTSAGSGTGSGGGILVDNNCARTILRNIYIIGANKYGIHQLGGVLDIRGSSILDTKGEPFSLWAVYTGTGIYLDENVIAYIDDSNIHRSHRYGLRQKGGSLTLYDSDIFDTRAKDELSASGTGIWLSDEVTAEFRSVQIYRSGSSALIVEDSGTTLDAAAVFIRDTHVNRFLWEDHNVFIGAVYVVAGAELDMGWSIIEDSEVAGLRASDAGSHIHFHDGSIMGTERVPGMEVDGVVMTGGINVQSTRSAHIELTGFRCTDGELVGLQLTRGGTIDASIGEVMDNVIGANIRTAGFDIMRLMDRVIYDNERNLDADSLPVPDTAIGL